MPVVRIIAVNPKILMILFTSMLISFA